MLSAAAGCCFSWLVLLCFVIDLDAAVVDAAVEVFFSNSVTKTICFVACESGASLPMRSVFFVVFVYCIT